MRTNLNMQFVCSICKEPLELDLGDTKNMGDGESSRVTAHSAYDMSAIVRVKPCSRCFYEANKIKNKVKEIIEDCQR